MSEDNGLLRAWEIFESVRIDADRHLRDGLPGDVALQAAQVELIHHGDFSAPYHWAAFQVYGEILNPKSPRFRVSP